MGGMLKPSKKEALLAQQNAAAATKPTPPAPMPDPNSPAILEARQKAAADMMSRAGRASTILSAGNNNTGDFSSSKLG